MENVFQISHKHLSIDDIARIIGGNMKIVLSDEAKSAINKCRHYLDAKMKDIGRYCEKIHRHCNRLSMEIPGRNYHILIREDIRIVGGTVDFNFNRLPETCNLIFDSSMHLRNAPESIRVLNMLFVSIDQLATIKKLHYPLRGFDLAFMRPYSVRKRVERLYSAVIGFK